MLVDRFRAARDVLDDFLPRRRRIGRTYQGFIAALFRYGHPLLTSVQTHLRHAIESTASHHRLRCGWLAFSVDGTRIDCPRTDANKQYFGVSGKNNSGPQMLLTTLWHMGTGLPWAWMIGKLCEGERSHLRKLVELLPKCSLLVADAGFTGHDLLSNLASSGVSFLVRVGSNTTLLTKLGYAEFEGDDTVYLWPRAKARHKGRPPVVLRLIRLQPDRKHPVFLITNVLDENALSVRDASILYQMRWGVEVFFRGLKQTLARRVMRSGAPNRAVMELRWTMIGLQLLGLLSVSRMVAAGADPLSWSVAMALRAAREQMRRATGSLLQLLGRLGRAIKDTYRRTRPKAASGWPRKKKNPQPKPPRVRAATHAEVKAAQRLVLLKMGS